jgi:hypothetical protein
MTRLLSLTVLALLPMLARGEGYICITDMATGFAYRNEAWRETSFKPNEKFIVRPPRDGEHALLAGHWGIPDAKWVVERLGQGVGSAGCLDFDAAGNLFCNGAVMNFVIDDFRMNKNSLRFLHAYLAGYWDKTSATGDGRDTPFIDIGKCSSM